MLVFYVFLFINIYIVLALLEQLLTLNKEQDLRIKHLINITQKRENEREVIRDDNFSILKTQEELVDFDERLSDSQEFNNMVSASVYLLLMFL